MHIYVVDESGESRRRITECIAKPPHQVSEFETASGMLAAMAEEVPDLIVAEIRLPDSSGFSLSRQVRGNSRTQDVRILLVSRWASEWDRIFAFECGADDFVARPFSRREVMSRIEAVTRRRRPAKSPSDDTGPNVADFDLPLVAREVLRRDGVGPPGLNDLTPKESSVLMALIAADGRPLTRDELIRQAWDAHSTPSTRCIDSHVKALRKKLEPGYLRIETVRGLGYRCVAAAGSQRGPATEYGRETMHGK